MKGDRLRVGCAAESLFYRDVDGDGWGDPDSLSQPLCEADAENQLTASNGRDCDDVDANITGRVGRWCPQELFPEVGAEYAGLVIGETEYLYAFGTSTPTLFYADAITSCQHWGAQQLEGDVWTGGGQLATFDSAAAIATIQSAITDPEGGAAPASFAGFIGIQWDGDWNGGGWSWVDDSDDSLISSSFTFCNGSEPTVEEVYESLYLGDADHGPFLEDTIDDIRLAMVLTEAGAWCLGIPSDVGEPSDNDATAEGFTYEAQSGHLICEREKPNPEDYQEFTQQQDEAE
jgi:hypothetical protein